MWHREREDLFSVIEFEKEKRHTPPLIPNKPRCNKSDLLVSNRTPLVSKRIPQVGNSPHVDILLDSILSKKKKATSRKSSILKSREAVTPVKSVSHPDVGTTREIKSVSHPDVGTTREINKIHGYLRQHDIHSLRASTNYNERQLYILFNRFKALCGLSSTMIGVDKETFRQGVPMLSVEDDLFVDRVFEILDDDGSGVIEWGEFIGAMSSLEQGSRESMAEFLFKVSLKST